MLTPLPLRHASAPLPPPPLPRYDEDADYFLMAVAATLLIFAPFDAAAA